ncbi:hypothetical protein [Ferruginibacter sp. HRS2-29]|uniref:hypothetical protein n=1 Tax=Ferruginibacter sp. HRS2-29 TaxID=2487334 RepID=UPI0020CCC4CC|nr:hypothetical protein [Ferruginibacter sp. HRS2-29]MCP9750585.1 hypothetical protein [Ferruginibacter sp. HRS2-29]
MLAVAPPSKKILPVCFLLLICYALFSCNETGGPKSDAGSLQPADTLIRYADSTKQLESDPIREIRRQVERINTAKLDAKHAEFICDEKTTVDKFYENGQLVKIAVDFGTVGDTYAREQYYYADNRLIFKYAYVEGGPACEGCLEKNEYRSYISKDKVIRYLKDSLPQQCRVCEFPPSTKEYRLLNAGTPEEIKRVLCF